MPRLKLLALPFLAIGLLSACASTPGDPLSGYNHAMFNTNTAFDEAIMMPAAKGYRNAVPEPARDGVHNFLDNINEPTNFANNLLQGEPDRAGNNFARFLINSTIGIGGLFDPAGKMGITPATEDFGQTLAVWGVDQGTYVVLPFFGSSSVRDTVGLGVDILTHPVVFVRYDNGRYWRMGRFALEGIDTRERLLGTVSQLREDSLDPYASFRTLYEQTRKNAINNGKVQVDDLPDFGD